MDAMTWAQIWMASYLIMTGYSWRPRGNGWITLLMIIITMVSGTIFVSMSGYWPLFVLPATMFVVTVYALVSAWKQALQDVKDAQ